MGKQPAKPYWRPTRPAYSPAALITYPAAIGPDDVRTVASPRPPLARPRYAVPVATVIPALRASATSAAITAAGETLAVGGENSARSRGHPRRSDPPALAA